MTDARSHWYLDQTAQPFCGHGEQPVYTDGRNTYVHCPTCNETWMLANSDTYYSASTEPRKLTHLSDKAYEENPLQHGVIR